MAQILIKGESVYKCDTCMRKIRMLTSREGIDVVQRCTITHGCRGKLLRLKDAKEVNSTPAFPTEVAGVQDWFQRRVVYTHTQPVKAKRWTIKHNLANNPLVYAFVSRQTESSATYTLTATAGAMWHKSTSGYDENNPYAPTAAGLYTYNGTSWVMPENTIPVGSMGNGIFEYMSLVEPDHVAIIDSNTVEVTFGVPQSGILQCVALASQNTSNPIIDKVVDTSTPFKLSNNGEITIATLNPSPNINVTVNFKSAVVTEGIVATFYGVDNTTSIASPWVGVGHVFVNGRTYTVRSFNLAQTPPTPGIVASGSVDPRMAKFTFEGLSSNIHENLILLGTSPFSTVDRIYDKFVDIATLNRFNPEIYYNTGEIYVSQSAIKSVYPLIYTVD